MPSFRAVDAVRPVAPYIGGKKQLAAQLVALIERMPHDVYAEPFVGMGGVFLRRTSAPKVEVINDASRDVATLFRVLQNHYQAFLDMLKWQLTSRAEFERLSGQDPERLTDLQRAARFLYVQRLTFGGKVTSRTFGVDRNGPARFDVTKLAGQLAEVHARMAGVWIECLGWSEFIDRWDRRGALFYVDPPYWGTEHFYGRGMFGPDDQHALAARLRTLKGRFILTLNDVPEVRQLYSWANVTGVKLTYTASGQGTPARELIIRTKAGSTPAQAHSSR
jgi:DNA adenine methylase